MNYKLEINYSKKIIIIISSIIFCIIILIVGRTYAFFNRNTLSDMDDIVTENTNNTLKYTDEFNACSLYDFTIKNTSNVTQKINATLTPNPNTFTNLYYI